MELASKDDAKGKCPACRTEYDEGAITFDEVPEEELGEDEVEQTPVTAELRSEEEPVAEGNLQPRRWARPWLTSSPPHHYRISPLVISS